MTSSTPIFKKKIRKWWQSSCEYLVKKWRNQRCLNENYSQKGIEAFVWQYGKNGVLKNACFAKTATVYHTYVWGNFVAHGSNSHKMYFTKHSVWNFVARFKMGKNEFQNLIVFFKHPVDEYSISTEHQFLTIVKDVPLLQVVTLRSHYGTF